MQAMSMNIHGTEKPRVYACKRVKIRFRTAFLRRASLDQILRLYYYNKLEYFS